MVLKTQAEEANSTILIIDDNPDNRLLLASQLGMYGYSIIEADGGRQGIEKASNNQPDLILLDVMMPIMNGFDVCEVLKAGDSTKHIPVIMVTALRDVEYRIRGIEAGADEFLSRPHHREELLVRVRSLIRLKQARDHLEKERNRLQLLYDVTQATFTHLNLNQTMSEIISYTQSAVGATKGSIMLMNDDGEVTHKILIRAGLTPEMTEHVTRAVLNRGLAGWLIRHKRGDIIENAAYDDRWITLPDDTEQVGSAIGVPLIRRNDALIETVIGVLILVHPDPGYFREEHRTLLETIAAHVSVAVDNASLFNRISEERAKLTAILGQSSDAIITTDEERNVELFNPAAEHSFDISSSDVIDKQLDTLPELGGLVPLFNEAADKPVGKEIPLEKDRTMFASVSPIPDIGFMAVLQDITEIKRAEEIRVNAERRQKELVKETFMRYMSPALVDQVLTDEPSMLGRRERRMAVVLFADLRGFTRMVVDLDPDNSITILNEFFTHMTNVVYEYEGTIFDLAGDELMIGFNAPLDQVDASYRAVLTGVSMQRRFDELRRDWYKRSDTELGLGIGVDAGNVIMGNVGADKRLNFAMVGEAVNTAHRLVDIAQDGEIVVSTMIYNEMVNYDLDNDVMKGVAFESMGKIPLKGKPIHQELFRAQLPRTPLTD